MKNFINSYSNDLVHWLWFIAYISAYNCPNQIMNLLRLKFVENTVWASKNIVKAFAPIFLVYDVRLWYNNIWVSTKLWLFRLKITKGPTYRQPPWKNSVWTNERIIHCVLILWWLLNSYLLQAWLSVSIYHRMGLVNMSTGSLDPFKFRLFARLMIKTQVNSLLPKVLRSNSSTVTRIDDEEIIIKSHD